MSSDVCPKCGIFSSHGIECAYRTYADDEYEDRVADEREFYISQGMDPETLTIGHYAEMEDYCDKAYACRKTAARSAMYIPDDHYVYFVSLNEEGLIKIGASKVPEMRNRQLSKMFVDYGTCMLIGYTECTNTHCQFRHPERIRTTCLTEEYYFRRFSRERLNKKSEWFRDRGEVSKLIADMMSIVNDSGDTLIPHYSRYRLTEE